MLSIGSVVSLVVVSGCVKIGADVVSTTMLVFTLLLLLIVLMLLLMFLLLLLEVVSVSVLALAISVPVTVSVDVSGVAGVVVTLVLRPMLAYLREF